MGFLSFFTVEGYQIINKYAGFKNFTVYIILPDGSVFEEPSYEGYGVFGGKDYFAAIAEINMDKVKDVIDLQDVDKLRDVGIDLYYGESAGLHYPQLCAIKTDPADLDFAVPCKDDPNQGYFSIVDFQGPTNDDTTSTKIVIEICILCHKPRASPDEWKCEMCECSLEKFSK